MLSRTYLKQLEERSRHVKVAFLRPGSLNAKILNFVQPFQKHKMYNDFVKNLTKQQGWIKHTDQGVADVVKYMHDKQPLYTTFARTVHRNPEKFAKRIGEGYKQYYMKTNPEMYSVAQKALNRNRALKYTGAGAGALGAGAYLLG